MVPQDDEKIELPQRSRLTELDRIKIGSEYRAGINQRALATRYGVSVGTINNIVKGMVCNNAAVVDQLVEVHDRILNSREPVDIATIGMLSQRKLQDIQYLRDATLKIIYVTMEKIEKEGTMISFYDLERAQNIIGKGRENMYGKSPDVAVQINNNDNPTANPNLADLSLLTLEEKIELKKKLTNG